MKISETLPLDGTAIPTAALAAHKTLFAEVLSGAVEVQASADGQFFCTVATLDKNHGHALLDVAATHMRIGRSSGSVASVAVVAEQGRIRSGVVPASPTNGAGDSLDVSEFGSKSTVYVAKEPGGTLTLQVSADDSHFVDVLGPVAQSSCSPVDLPARFVRAVGKNATGSISFASEDPAGRALSSPAPAFVFRPGGVAGGNVYTDWPRLVEALSSMQGRRILEFDDSTETPCVISAGTWPMKDVSWSGHGPRAQTGAFRTVVDIHEGTRFTNLRMIGGQITLRNFATETPPVSDFTSPSHVNIGLRDDCGTPELLNLGAAPLFDLGSNDVTFFIQNSLFGVRSTRPLIRHTGGACTLVSLGLNQIGEDVVTGTAGGLVRFAAVSSAAGLGRRQESITANGGTIAYEPTGRIQRRVLPLPPASPLVANTPIGVPNALVRCDGTNGFDMVLPSIQETRLAGPTGLRIYTGGHEIVVAEVAGGAGLRVVAAAGDTIDGQAGPVPIAAHGSRTFISDGSTNWITISLVG